jgi:peptidoglycan L-alanyl-D-glutamate endopeptidase CwlK
MSSLLRLSSSGPDVSALQQALLAAGFSPGAIDGSFGPGTQAAVIAFQKSNGLAADGIVGPNTATALGLTAVPSIPSAIPSVTVDIVSQLFPATRVANIQANLPVVLAELAAANLSDKAMVLMALGTIRAETESFLPISEGQSRFNTSPGGHPFDLYDNRADLGNTGAPDGASFRGRGFVQLTGRANYTKYSGEINVDLVANPDQANDPQIAARLLARFLGDHEDRIREALAAQPPDFRTARRLVNGGSLGLDPFTDVLTRGMALIPDPS